MSAEDFSAVLLLNGQYSTNTTNRQVAQIVTGAGRKVYSTVLEDTEEDKKCAEADGVELILPTRSQGDTRIPSLDWLTFDHPGRYPSLPEDVGYIVGHAEVTSKAAAAIQEQRFPQANLGLVIETIPEDTEKYKDDKEAMDTGEKEDSIRQDAEKADVVFSVGHNVEDHFTNSFSAIHENIRPTHHLFLPKPSDLFQKTTVKYRETNERVVLSIGGVNKVERVKGYDLAAKSLVKVAETSLEKILWRICDISEEEFQATMSILQASINSGKLIPTLYPRCTQEDICRHMQQAHLVLLPSRAEPFGLVGLEAMAAGVPVLISDQSGLATLVDKVIPEFHPSVLEIVGDDSVDVGRWASQIGKVLRKSEAEFRRAADLKAKLLESRYWEESHQQLLQAFGGAAGNTERTRPDYDQSSEHSRPARLAIRQTDLPVHLNLGVQPPTAGGQAGDIDARISKRLLKLERTLFTKDVFKDRRRYKKTRKLFRKHKAFLLKEAMKAQSILLLLTFLRQTDVDRFYHNHYRVGEGTLSQQLSHILISDDLQDKVKGAQLIVRLQVKHEDYVRVRDRLGQGLDRTTSVTNLLALPPPSREVDRSSLRGLDLAVVSREDQLSTDSTDDIPTLSFTARQVQTAMQTSKKKPQQQVMLLEAKLQTMREQVHTAREQTKYMVGSLTREVTRLKDTEEKAQKILLEHKEEIQKLNEVNKSMADTIEELMNAKHTAKGQDYGTRGKDPGVMQPSVGDDESDTLWPSAGDDGIYDVKRLLHRCTTLPSSNPRVYSMTRKPRGHVFILNNKYFAGLPLREGTHMDAENVKKLFQGLFFTTETHQNLITAAIHEKLRDFAVKNHQDSDCCVVVLLSHGGPGGIFGTDSGGISFQEILRKFDGENCPDLIGKPKLFFVQACRGDEKGPVSFPDIPQSIPAQVLPSMPDIFVAYATHPGSVSWRNSYKGSWFICALMEVFLRHAATKDICELMTMVDYRVNQKMGSSTSHSQRAVFLSTLTKYLYLNPGIFVSSLSDTTEGPSIKQEPIAALSLASYDSGFETHFWE